MRVALVTGSAQGIGFAIVKNLLEKGDHKVFGVDIQEQSDEIEGYEENTFIPLKCDLSDSDACRKLVRDIGNVDVLVNNASYANFVPFETLSEDKWDKTFQVNLKAPFYLTREAFPIMSKKKNGRI